MSSTSSTQLRVQPPLSSASLPAGPKVSAMALRPRPPWAFSHRKISYEPAQIPPKSGGSPHAHDFSHPSFSNHEKLSWMLVTLRIGVIRFGCIFIRRPLKGAPYVTRLVYFFRTNFISCPLTESAT